MHAINDSMALEDFARQEGYCFLLRPFRPSYQREREREPRGRAREKNEKLARRRKEKAREIKKLEAKLSFQGCFGISCKN